MGEEIFDDWRPAEAPKKFEPRENPSDSKTIAADDLVRLGTDDEFMSFQGMDGRRYTTRDHQAWVPAKDAEQLARVVPGVNIIRPTSRGIGPGSKVNSRPRHEYFPGDCACEECKEKS